MNLQFWIESNASKLFSFWYYQHIEGSNNSFIFLSVWDNILCICLTFQFYLTCQINMETMFPCTRGG